MGSNLEFVVVILAGGAGIDLYPLTDGKPKLEFLDRAGFTDVLIVTTEPLAEEITQYLANLPKGRLRPKLHVVSPDLGTAELIFELKDEIDRDFIVMPCDLIISGQFLHPAADLHRAQDSGLTIVFCKAAAPPKHPDLLVGINDDDSRVMIYSPGSLRDAFEEEPEHDVLQISKDTLTRCPSLSISSCLVDSHFYIVSRRSLDVFPSSLYSMFRSFSEDFVPALVRVQHLIKRKKIRAAFAEDDSVLEDKMELDPQMKSSYTLSSPMPVYSIVLPSDCYCLRVRNLEQYRQANHDVAHVGATSYAPAYPEIKGSYVSTDASISKQTQMGSDCVVGAHSKIGDRCSVKKSIVGSHCSISGSVKLVNSVIMDNVTIEEKCLIQNSVVCSGATIHANCEVRDSQVGPGFRVESGKKLKNDSVRLS